MTQPSRGIHPRQLCFYDELLLCFKHWDSTRVTHQSSLCFNQTLNGFQSAELLVLYFQNRGFNGKYAVFQPHSGLPLALQANLETYP